MPQTRTTTSREDKVEDLLDVAEALFEEHGFAGTSTARLARTAGVSEKTLFWYFPSKDHVLVAVVERAAVRIDARLRRRRRPGDSIAAGLYRVLRAMRSIRHLLPAMHQRAEVSEHVAVSRERFRAFHRRAIAAGLHAAGVPEEDLEAAVTIVVCFADGALLRNIGDRELRRLCDTLVERLSSARMSRSRGTRKRATLQ